MLLIRAASSPTLVQQLLSFGVSANQVLQLEGQYDVGKLCAMLEPPQAPWPNGKGIGVRSRGLQVRVLPGSL